MFDLADKFFELKTDKPQIFYVLRDTYELDIGCIIKWDTFEKFCEYVSGRAFYGTNGQRFGEKNKEEKVKLCRNYF